MLSMPSDKQRTNLPCTCRTKFFFVHPSALCSCGACVEIQFRHTRLFLNGCVGWLCFVAFCGIFQCAAAETLPLKYAKGFSLEYRDSYKFVTVFSPWEGAKQTFQYVLTPRGATPPPGYAPQQIIEIPVRSFVAMSTTYFPCLEMIGELPTLAGYADFTHVNTPAVREMIQRKQIQEVGDGPGVNIELLMAMRPDVIMSHGTGSVQDAFAKLSEAKLPVVVNGAYMETTPLGRAEWIKFIAAFYNKEREAERLFDEIAASYERLTEKASSLDARPTVFLNAPYQGNWWIPGGQSYMAAYLRDAGADYLWGENAATGSMMLNFEAVYAKAADAEFWLHPGQWNSLRDGLAADERFGKFKAFREGRVYNNNARTNASGGSDYWESGTMRPDVVLADLIKIFHPELAPDHAFVYYQQLQ